jgi:hypothetical protein
MTIDISKIKPGDKVTLVPLEVDKIFPHCIQLALPSGGCFYVKGDDLAAHHPAPREIGVGDRVKQANGTVGTVIAHDTKEAWVKWDSFKGNWTMSLDRLTLVETFNERA